MGNIYQVLKKVFADFCEGYLRFIVKVLGVFIHQNMNPHILWPSPNGSAT